MTFRWRDPDRLTSWAMTSADAFSLRSLLRYIETEIDETEIDGDRKLLDADVDGDWISREGATVEQEVHALENIIQRALRLRISLAFREVERDVVVVRGDDRSSPVEGRKADQIEIYGKQIVPNGGGAGGGRGDFAMFLKWVGEWIERPVVGEVEAPPREVSWYYNARSPFTKEMRREDHDEGLVLKHLAEQTGLTFTRERRVIRVLFVEKAR
jgi:hypothetical protein